MMSFNNSYTAVTGATYQASDYNTHTKGNFTAIWVGTTAGDLDYYTSSTSKARLALVTGGLLYGGASAPAYLAPSTAGKVLKTNGIGSEWAPMVSSRQGGSSTIWSNPGTTTYTPTSTIIQAGSQNITVSSGGTNSVAITYPTAFSERPLILLGANITGALASAWSLGWVNDTTTGFELHLKFVSTSQTGTYTVCWVAIGA